MSQGTLFENWVAPPAPGHGLSRRTDPETSREAAAELVTSGQRDRLIDLADSLVREYPGKTAAELEGIADVRDGVIRKRLNDLWDEGRGPIRKGEKRRCGVTGRNAQTWFPETSTEDEA